MAIVRTDGVFGRTSNNPLLIGDLTLTSTGLEDLDIVTGGDVAYLVLDPEKEFGAIEIVQVTAHSASSDTATIVRGQLGTSARQHDLNTYFVHGVIANDFDHGGLDGRGDDDHAIYTLADGTRVITGAQQFRRSGATLNLVEGDVSSDTNDRVVIRADGRITWGSGSAAGDTNLYRTSANKLKTDDDLAVGGGNIEIGADCEIYRDSANALRTPDSFRIEGGARFDAEVDIYGSADTDEILEVYVDGDTDPRFASNAAGNLEWGTGASSADTNLDRSGANELTTDDSLVVGGDLTVGSTPFSHVPAGAIMAFAEGSTPSGWLNCDGSEVNRTGAYADLFALVGTTYGVGNGSTTFNLPDLRGQTVVGEGAGDGLTPRTLAATGGEEDHQIALGEMASHTHGSAGSHRHQPANGAYRFVSHQTIGGTDFVSTSGNSKRVDSYTAYAGSHTHPSVGSNTAHNTMQPFIVLRYIIKY